MELGTIGGTNVSHVNANLVDLENELMNRNRPNTKCPSYLFNPNEPVGGKEYIKPVQHPRLDTSMRHLQNCQMVDYGAVPLTPTLNLFSCTNNGCNYK
jgi:hypothetical protein